MSIRSAKQVILNRMDNIDKEKTKMSNDLTVRRRAERFIEETANSHMSTVFAANIIIKKLLAELDKTSDAK